MKSIRSTIALFLPLAALLFVAADNNKKQPFDDVNSRFQAWQKAFPEDRVYAMSDKPFYAPGETVWFSVFVRDGFSLTPSGKSEIVYAELLNPKGSVEKKIALCAKNGIASGDFILGSDAPGGLYSLKVYTNWQKNDGDPAIFTKELQVQSVVLPRLKMKLDFAKKAYGAADKVSAAVTIETNENKPLADKSVKFKVVIAGKSFFEGDGKCDAHGTVTVVFTLPKKLLSTDGLLSVFIDYDGQTESIARSIPIVFNAIALSFFPEGGDLVEGIPANVAFKAVNEFGKAADIEGYISGDGKTKVAEFKSYHRGMGVFTFTPKNGVTYKAHISKPMGINDTFDLPEAMLQGYVLSVDNSSKNILKVSIDATRKGPMRLFIQMRGKEVYSKEVVVAKRANTFKIDISEFPAGVAQVTLFDANNIERAERLVFVNSNKQAVFAIKANKDKYQPRENVKLTITATDNGGMRMPGRVALAVVDDQLLSFADDKSSTILTQMLFEADVKGTIEEPRFYFDKKEEKADKALDLLLLTNGWRRFTWEQIINNKVSPARFTAEKMVVAGMVMDGATQKGAAGVTVQIVSQNLVTQTDSTGAFVLKGVELYEPQTIEVKKGKLEARNIVTTYTNDLELWLSQQRHPRLRRPVAGAFGGAQNEMVKQNRLVDLAMEQPMAAPLPPEMPMPMAAMEQKPQPVVKEKKRAVLGKRLANRVVPVLQKKELRRGAMDEMDEMPAPPPPPPEIAYYRTRQYAIPDYSKQAAGSSRTDFRSTIYWQGDVALGKNGSATVEFFTNDAITSFRATAEGFTRDGGVGRAETTIYSQPPFGISVKIPPVVLTGDTVTLQVLIKNFTDKPLDGEFTVSLPAGCKTFGGLKSAKSIAAKSSLVIPCTMVIVSPADSAVIGFSFAGKGFSDEMKAPLKIMPQGFPVEQSFSGAAMKRDFTVSITNAVEHSVSATLRAYPSVVSDLLTGIESVLSEPYGCFEQTSMTSYPNALVLSYLKTSDSSDPQLVQRAEELLRKGYKRLTTFETKEKGYEWFGQEPGHEALSAYGLMQFSDMEKVGGMVDKKMVDRTATWLMSRRDGNGGFQRNSRALDSYGSADGDITNAYIVYALAEAGRRDIQKELDASVALARKSDDPYMLALMSNALFCFEDDKRGDELLKLASAKQEKDGSWCGTRHSITRSGGISLKLETTALMALAIMKSKKPDVSALTAGVKFLLASRSGDGGFGATQSTILSLKALTAYAQFARKTDAPGVFVVLVDKKEVARKEYAAGEKGAIVIDSLENYLKTGEQTITVQYESTKSALPYSLAVNYNTWKPVSSPECKVALATTAAVSEVAVGSGCRITTVLKNTTEEGLPMTVAIIGIPAGLTPQPWQLKELQEKKVVDFYEISGAEVIFYYRQMKPGEERTIQLDCKAEIPGKYTAAASRAYLYYTNEYKVWSAVKPVSVVTVKSSQ